MFGLCSGLGQALWLPSLKAFAQSSPNLFEASGSNEWDESSPVRSAHNLLKNQTSKTISAIN